MVAKIHFAAVFGVDLSEVGIRVNGGRDYGEASLAQHGVLFLNELPFTRSTVKVTTTLENG